MIKHVICVNQTNERESRENRVGGISEAHRRRYLIITWSLPMHPKNDISKFFHLKMSLFLLFLYFPSLARGVGGLPLRRHFLYVRANSPRSVRHTRVILHKAAEDAVPPGTTSMRM